jgi:hypothetical protein
MARLMDYDETFEMLVMAQGHMARHGGVETVEAIEVSIFCMTILL